ncbi:MAG: tetratricopeptide repeat protein [Terracidiphilus sp.]
MMSNPAAELVARGFEARGEKRLADAKNCFAQAVDRCRKANDRLLLAQALSGLGQIERDMGNSALALRHYSDAVSLRRTQEDPLLLAHGLRHIADILREQSNLAKAAPCYEEALEIYRSHELAPPLDLANTIRGYALLKADVGDPEEATFLWHEAMALYAEAGVQAGVEESQSQIAFLMGR